MLSLGICEIDNGWLSFSVRSKKPNSLKEKYCYLHAAYSLFPLPFKQPIPKYSSKQAFQEPCLANLLPISQGCIIKSEIFAFKILTLYLCALLQDQVSISFFHLCVQLNYLRSFDIFMLCHSPPFKEQFVAWLVFK